ncbi:Ribonuclease T2 precursor (RNase T2) [Microbotryomycetes sp. JL221]|nr:Ribonuclease T2 precursor (RNase T2) [Microbotryomycetes sp. JL221]
MLAATSIVASALLISGSPAKALPLDARNAATCPTSTGLSCPSSSNVNTCCTNYPGGLLLLFVRTFLTKFSPLRTQFWDYDPGTGPADSWTVHGLWPDNCDGTYEANCDPSREHDDIRTILQQGGASSTLSYMDTYWKDYQGQDESFWSHEWNKHGTCLSVLEPSCYTSYVQNEEVVDYFERAVSLFKTLPTYSWLADAGITPSTTKTYSLGQLQAVANAKFGHDIVWNCRNGALNEAWFFYNTRGNIVTGTFYATDAVGSSNCPSTGIKYLPKGTSTSTSSAPASTPTSGSTSNLNVINSSNTKQGCLISTGKWMVGSTCAGYTTTMSGSGLTLTTSKGPCAIVSGTFSCASGQSATTFTKDSNGYLSYSGRNTFYATSAPSGSTQATVYTSSQNVSIKLRIG